MEPVPSGPFRIYRPDSGDPEPADPRTLAARELLRPPAARPCARELEPFARAWFEEIEVKRYAPHGGWLRRVLEFTRHPNETLLMLGPGVGTDAPRYSARSLRRLFAPFAEHKVAKRHLRRSELPHLWRFLPVSALERLAGRVLVLRAFKPVAAAMEAASAESAA